MKYPLLHGLIAGAAGTTALNAVTYLDMAVRGRPSSTTPEQTVHRIEEVSGRALDPEGTGSEKAGNRRSGLGALLGITAGLGSGVLHAGVRSAIPHAPSVLMALAAGAAANIGSVAPMTALGVTDPRQWPASSWAMDIIPHLAYGAVTAMAYDRLQHATRPAGKGAFRAQWGFVMDFPRPSSRSVLSSIRR